MDPVVCDALRGVVVVGEWPALPVDVQRLHTGDGAEIVRCPPGLRPFQRLLREFESAGWVLVGSDQDDDATNAVLRSMRRVRPDCFLAMLGSRYDWSRCERWLRRGCKVYLEATSGIDRMLATLGSARLHNLMVVDSCFLEEVRRQIPLDSIDRLTKRQTDVLRLVQDGLSNRNIAAELHVSENTIEFHVANLLGKLAARNRLEAVERARAMGI